MALNHNEIERIDFSDYASYSRNSGCPDYRTLYNEGNSVQEQEQVVTRALGDLNIAGSIETDAYDIPKQDNEKGVDFSIERFEYAKKMVEEDIEMTWKLMCDIQTQIETNETIINANEYKIKADNNEIAALEASKPSGDSEEEINHRAGIDARIAELRDEIAKLEAMNNLLKADNNALKNAYHEYETLIIKKKIVDVYIETFIDKYNEIMNSNRRLYGDTGNTTDTYNANGGMVVDDNDRVKYAYSQHVKYDEDGNIITGQEIDGYYLEAWDYDYYLKYGKAELNRRNHRNGYVADVSNSDMPPCAFWLPNRNISTSGCSAAAACSAIATIYGGTVSPDGKEISPVEFISLYPSETTNNGGFGQIITDEYGLQTANDISFGKINSDGEPCLDTLLESGGAVIRTVNSSKHYVAITDIKHDGENTFYYVVDPNKKDTSVGTWVLKSDSNYEWTKIAYQQGSQTMMIAPANMDVYDACGLGRNV